jgi:hypothetical protein
MGYILLLQMIGAPVRVLPQATDREERRRTWSSKDEQDENPPPRNDHTDIPAAQLKSILARDGRLAGGEFLAPPWRTGTGGNYHRCCITSPRKRDRNYEERHHPDRIDHASLYTPSQSAIVISGYANGIGATHA